VVTRKWEEKLKTLKDVSIPTSPGVIHEKNDNFEVYYMPYAGNLRDRIYKKHGDSKFRLLRQSLTFIELFFQYIFNSFIPYSNLYTQADKLCKEESFDCMIASGNPFNLFKFGFLINKKYKLKWIADYRDGWSTSEINDVSSSIFKRIIHKLDTIYERKWVSTASYVTASSQPIGKSIEMLTGVRSTALFNGILFEDFDDVNILNPLKDFTITYVGTLYDGQKIEFFCKAYKEFIQKYEIKNAKLLFPGLAFFGEQESRVQKALSGYEQFFECSERIPREEILELEKKSHLLLHVAWQGYKGIIASKIYEYIASGTKIIVAPSDDGAIHQIVENSGCGVMISDNSKLIEFLKVEYDLFLSNNTPKNRIDSDEVQQFSREKQVEGLVQIINSI
tara:strand:- start:1683 stop:2858 length:1176 start_codon:yes stop_codon:yes gene_type:complete